jgi:hypothetical protein
MSSFFPDLFFSVHGRSEPWWLYMYVFRLGCLPRTCSFWRGGTT